MTDEQPPTVHPQGLVPADKPKKRKSRAKPKPAPKPEPKDDKPDE